MIVFHLSMQRYRSENVEQDMLAHDFGERNSEENEKKKGRGRTLFYQASSRRATIPPGFCKERVNIKD